MDPDSKPNALVRLAPWILAGLIIGSAAILVAINRLDGKDLIALVGSAISLAGVSRMMSLPSATTTTKETDPSGKVTETKTQQPLGMPPAPAAVLLTPAGPEKGPTP